MKYKIFTLLLALAVSTGATLCASNTQVDGIWYDFDSSTLTASVTYNGTYYHTSNKYTGSVIIPSSVTYNGDTYKVTSIGDEAFDNCDELTSVTIPNSVVYIGVSAFDYCTSLTSITIPNSVTHIGDNAFWNCTGLTSPVYNEHVFAYMPTTYAGTYVIPNGIITIAGGAFSECGDLKSITIPESVKSIGAWTFNRCASLVSITIPSTLTSIGEGAFQNCGSLTSITVPNSVTEIGPYAFGNCYSLVDVKLSNNLTSIADYLFRDCLSLSSIVIPNAVTSIGEEAFVNTILTSITVPNSVTDISKKAFRNCSFLDTVILGDGISHIGEEAFKETALYNNTKNWEERVLYIGDYLIEASRTYYNDRIYTIKPGTLCVAESAFYNHYDMYSITIPSSVRNIGNNAFARCHSLEIINNYADMPQSIEQNVFYNIDISECILNVPEECVDLYAQADVWKDFGHIIPCYADKIEDADLVIIPSETTVKIAWLAVEGADKYELVITKKNGTVVCRFTFDAQGLLIDVAFRAPSHDNAPLHSQEVGFVYLVMGLDSGTAYNYSIIAKNSYNATINTETGTFNTKSTEALENTAVKNGTSTKILRNGQILILRGAHTYTLTGQEVK